MCRFYKGGTYFFVYFIDYWKTTAGMMHDGSERIQETSEKKGG